MPVNCNREKNMVRNFKNAPYDETTSLLYCVITFEYLKQLVNKYSVNTFGIRNRYWKMLHVFNRIDSLASAWQAPRFSPQGQHGGVHVPFVQNNDYFLQQSLVEQIQNCIHSFHLFIVIAFHLWEKFLHCFFQLCLNIFLHLVFFIVSVPDELTPSHPLTFLILLFPVVQISFSVKNCPHLTSQQ